jgi:hypothetical protein
VVCVCHKLTLCTHTLVVDCNAWSVSLANVWVQMTRVDIVQSACLHPSRKVMVDDPCVWLVMVRHRCVARVDWRTLQPHESTAQAKANCKGMKKRHQKSDSDAARSSVFLFRKCWYPFLFTAMQEFIYSEKPAVEDDLLPAVMHFRNGAKFESWGCCAEITVCLDRQLRGNHLQMLCCRLAISLGQSARISDMPLSSSSCANNWE